MSVELPEWALVPVFSITYVTNVSADEVLDCMRELMQQEEGSERALVGEVQGNSFLFNRRFRGRNSFAPYFKGVVSPTEDGCTADVQVEVFFLGFVMWAIGIAAVFDVAKNPWFRAAAVTFGVVLAFTSFLVEYRKGKRILGELFEERSGHRTSAGVGTGVDGN